MIPKILNKINWLKSIPNITNHILRGIERETLRVTLNGEISKNDHPYNLGSALTNKWITTDFSESLLEFITPPIKNLDSTLKCLCDIHKFASKNINDEYFWPFSVPPSINSQNSIILAKYGTSKIGKMKTLYRVGLKNRYSTIMNIISGIHYNFSLPMTFWKTWKQYNKVSEKHFVSNGYLSLIRNFYKFGWIIPYLFGTSPAIEPSFIKNKKTNLNFHTTNGILYLPWSTSLRLSKLGHNNESIKNLKLTFNSLNSYISSLRYGLKTSSKKFEKLGLIDSYGNLKQINTNILQLENELYTYIRPKTILNSKSSILNTFTKQGIQYVEIRSLDINPFSHIGINKTQILLLDLFLIWCSIIDSPKITNQELQYYSKNWEIISLEGRRPQQTIYTTIYNQKKKLESVGKNLIENLFYIAEILDLQLKNNTYQKLCQKIFKYFDNIDLTYSKKILEQYMDKSIMEIGIQLAIKNKNKYVQKQFKILQEKDFINETLRSHCMQKKIENHDTTRL